MTSRFNLFDNAGDARETARNLPEGLRYRKELISAADERKLLAHLTELPFREFEFHGYTGKRRVVSFGWHYDFTGRQLRKADDIPEYLLALREAAAAFASMEPYDLQHVLVIEYGPGAGIGWHRDKMVFGQVVGLSLLSPCVLRFRRAIAKKKWERVNLLAEPRSAYHLSGPARYEWEHSILRVDTLRYSITFRNVLEN
ncbi:MAG TPA: alpha-ketoglutarate-dependent dioxygenase AlkB [Pyrinomonadaceae bacterium]|jgi:alkylated DNA repair dioxygenase AlkB